MEQESMMCFQEDDIVLQQGSMKQEMYKIISGKVAVYFDYGLPEEHLLGILSEQRCFGELSILCGKPSTYTVVALGELLVLRITEDNLEDFIKRNTQNAMGIMRNLANTINTLSLNLNMLNEELTIMSSEQSKPQTSEDITHRVRQYGALDSINKALFSTYV